MLIDPIELSTLLGQKYPPTEQQATVIQADLGPMLVVAGAGAGKTETMAARVVWLVANGLIDPDQVLGLTFTRKAAQQLGKRINDRLGQLAGIPDIAALDPSGRLATRLRSAGPTTSTYDAFAGKLVGEFGLLLPVEPSARIISQTELYRIAVQVVNEYEGELSIRRTTGHVVDTLLTLTAELDNHMVDERELKIESLLFAQLCEELPPAKRQRKKPTQGRKPCHLWGANVPCRPACRGKPQRRQGAAKPLQGCYVGRIPGHQPRPTNASPQFIRRGCGDRCGGPHAINLWLARRYRGEPQPVRH